MRDSHHGVAAPASPPPTLGPARIVIVDVDGPIADVDCRHPVAGRYDSLWVLAIRSDSPLGLLEVPVFGPVVDGAGLATRLREHLGARWDAPAGPPPENGAADLPTLAVVVPTNLARPEQLGQCVEALGRLDYPGYEIIVVDNRPAAGPEDGLLASLAMLANVRIVTERQPGISAARNRGVQATNADIVVFTDDDVQVHPTWLLAIGRRFVLQPDLAAVSGLVLPAELETPAQLLFEQSGNGLERSYEPLTFQLEPPHGPWWRRLVSSPKVARLERDGASRRISLYATGEFGLGSNMAFRAAVLRELGGFDRALGVGTATGGGEDLAMLLRVLMSGRKLGYEPAAIVHHTHRRSLEELEVQLRSYGTGFSAMVLALMCQDRRHLRGVLAAAPCALRAMTRADSDKRSGRSSAYPKELARAELVGMVGGPLAYVRARRATRRWAR